MMRKLLLAIVVLLAGVGESLGDSSTSRLGLTKPSIGSAGWAQKTNANWDLLDSSVAVQGRTNVFTGTNTFSSPAYLNSTVSIATTSTASPLTVNGLVQSLTGGFKFPDGSIQAAAAAGPTIGSAVSGAGNNRVLFTDSTGKLQNNTDLLYSTASSYLSLQNGAAIFGSTTVFNPGLLPPANGYHLNVNGGMLLRAISDIGGADFELLDSSSADSGGLFLDDSTHDFQVLASSSLVIGTDGGGQMKVVGNGGGHDILEIGGGGYDPGYLVSIIEPSGGPLGLIITDDPVAENRGEDFTSGIFDMWTPKGYFGGGGTGQVQLSADDPLNPSYPRFDLVSTHASQVWSINSSYANGTFAITDSTHGAEKLSIAPNGRVAIPTYTPATSGASCTTGELAWDTSYIYVCTSTNAWRRAAIASW